MDNQISFSCQLVELLSPDTKPSVLFNVLCLCMMIFFLLQPGNQQWLQGFVITYGKLGGCGLLMQFFSKIAGFLFNVIEPLICVQTEFQVQQPGAFGRKKNNLRGRKTLLNCPRVHSKPCFVCFSFALFFFYIILFYFMHRHVQKRHQTKLQAEPLLQIDFFCFVFLHFAHNDAHPTSPLHVRYDFGMMASWFMNLFSFIVCTLGKDPPSATPFIQVSTLLLCNRKTVAGFLKVGSKDLGTNLKKKYY